VKNLKLYSKVLGIPKRHLECGFKNYQTNPDNERQLGICKEWNGQESITLTGKPGTGKTHLAIAMMKNMPMIKAEEKTAERERQRLILNIENKRVHYTSTGEELGNEYFQKLLDSEIWKFRNAKCLFVSFVELFIEINTVAMSDEGKEKILSKYATGYDRSVYCLDDNRDPDYDCICFDDLGAEKLTDAKRENLYYIIDSRYREMLPTIITSNFTINEINDVEPRIASRLSEMGKIVQFNGKDFRKQNG
jgi:DNA replication protein DnaC